MTSRSAILILALGVALATGLGCGTRDTDRDGYGAHADACPTTPYGATLATGGCSPADLLLQPEVVTNTAHTHASTIAARHAVGTPAGLLGVYLNETKLHFENAHDDLRTLDPCSASNELQNAYTMADAALVEALLYFQTLPGPVVVRAEPPGTEGTTIGGGDPAYLQWRAEVNDINMLVDEVEEAMLLADQACNGLQGPASTMAYAVEVAPDRRSVKLDNGLDVVLAPDVSILDAATGGASQISSGDLVDVGGFSHNDGVLVANSVMRVSVGPDWSMVGLVDLCLQLRVLPNQKWPIHNQQWLMHHPDGYRRSPDYLALEEGMRIGILDVGCPGPVLNAGPNGNEGRLEYDYEVRLSYRTKTGTILNNKLLASNMDGGDTVGLPGDADPFYTGTLTATRYRRSCEKADVGFPIIDPATASIVGYRDHWVCTTPVAVSTESESVVIAERYSYCATQLAEVEFSVDESDPNAYASTFVTGVSSSAPGSPVFEANAKAIVQGQPAAYQDIGAAQSFAIYSKEVFPFGWQGTTAYAGLRFPRINGTSGGKPYRYTCSVPAVATDRLYSCTGVPNTFYKLGFSAGVSGNVGQGNFGPVSHNTWALYSLDWTAGSGSGEPILAARGGRVVRVRNNFTQNCLTAVCGMSGPPEIEEFGNHVVILHQDGTASWYLHMVHGSIVVSTGQVVQRGDRIGDQGNTGNSTSAHLHFHVTPGHPTEWTSSTVPVSYEGDYGNGPEGCLIPVKGDDVVSTNS